VRRKQRGQAIVEFGIIALLFTALMFAVVDFGLLLNTWLSVSSGAREVARNASVGKRTVFLQDEASRVPVPSVDRQYSGTWCCDASAAMHLIVEYFPSTCIPGPGCVAFVGNQIMTIYPAPDGSAGSCSTGTCHPQSDDFVRVTLVAQGAQVITPLLRPFFGCTNGTNPRCHVPLTSSVIMRFEGQEF
jgi:hypothetical protein